MAITAKFYGLYFKSLHNKEIDIDSDAIKLMLCTSSYVPNQDTHQYKSSVTNEVSGAGYTAGGASVTPITVGYDTVTNTMSYDAPDVTWTGATLIGANAPRIAVLYDSTPATDATRPLIGYIDFGDDSYAPNGGTLTVAWNASGIGAVTVS